tara:strand:+ start:139 stop:627 length:489 start_codon:yes stop_codon:yes gene_type:complete
MATNTLIQRLFSADESGVNEESNTCSNRVQHEIFRAGETITAGATVSLDFSQTSNGERALVVKEADAADVVGIGVYDGDTDGVQDTFIRICIRGIVENALVNGSGTNIAIGDALYRSVDGKLVAQEIDEDGSSDFNLKAPVAVAMEASTADETARVFVIKNY